MSKPCQRIAFGNRRKSQLECWEEFIQRARLRGTENGFDFRPAFLNRIEIGRVGRQELDARPARRDGRLDHRAFVGGQIIHYHNVTWDEGRCQDLFHIDFKGLTINGPVQEPRRLETRESDRRQQGPVLSRVTGHRIYHPFAGCRPSPQAGQAQVDPRFINAFEVRDDPRRQAGPVICSQRLDPLRIPFATVERLFFEASPTGATPGTSYSGWRPRRRLAQPAHTTRSR
jgi:hypothetical protein